MGLGDLDADGFDDLGVVHEWRDLEDESWTQIQQWSVFAGGLGGPAETALSSVYNYAGMFDPGLGEVGFAGLGDIDGDGSPEMGLGEAERDIVRIYSGGVGGVDLGTQRQLLASAYGLPSGADFGAHLGTAGDMDGDGVVDLWVAADSAIHLFRGGSTATLSWSMPMVAPFSTYPWAASLGDVDADGFADLGVCTDGRFTVVFGDAAASGVRHSLIELPGSRIFWQSSPAVGDVNGDDLQDLVLVAQRMVTGGDQWEVVVLVGNGVGWTESVALSESWLTGPPTPVLANIDGDDFDDIVLVADSGDSLDTYLGRADITPATGAWHLDADGDGYGDPATMRAAVVDDSWVEDATDCDDSRADVHPGADDVPEDGLDQDCAGGDEIVLAPDSGDPDVPLSDTGDTAEVPAIDEDTGTLPTAEEVEDTKPGGGCACSGASSSPTSMSLVVGLLALLWRRRAR